MATVCGYCLWLLFVACLWLLFVATVCGCCLWLLFVATVCGYCLWLLFVALFVDSVCGHCCHCLWLLFGLLFVATICGCLWLLFMATVCGYCLSLLFVATVCGYCLWLLFVATVCGYCLFPTSILRYPHCLGFTGTGATNTRARRRCDVFRRRTRIHRRARVHQRVGGSPKEGSLRPTALSPVDLSFLVRGCRLNTLSILNQLPCRRSLVEREHTRIRERPQLYCGFKASAGNIWLATFGWQHLGGRRRPLGRKPTWFSKRRETGRRKPTWLFADQPTGKPSAVAASRFSEEQRANAWGV